MNSINITIVAIIILLTIYHLYNKNKNIKNISREEEEEEKEEEEDKNYETKLENIVPNVDDIGKDDVIDFLFSIQEMYEYNPLSYEEMIDYIKAFLTIYDIIFDGPARFSDYYYQIAESNKINAVNSLHSIIHKLPTDNKSLMDKHTRAHKRLETILTYYLNELYDKCQDNLLKNGYSVYTRAINLGPKEYNTYDDKDYSYQFY